MLRLTSFKLNDFADDVQCCLPYCVDWIGDWIFSVRLGDAIADFGPAVFTALCLSVLVSVGVFLIVSFLVAQFALGLDFLIIVGGVVATAAAVAAFFFIFKKIRPPASS
jgi:hypothetical protein